MYLIYCKSRAMKYFIRSIKYFIYFSLLTTAIIAALVFTGLAEGDIDTMFRGGASAIWKIAVFFVAVAAVYPKVGFINRKIASDKNLADARAEIITYLQERHFVLESESRDTMTFRHRSAASRLTRMFEDRITVTASDGIIEMEGLRKDVFRLSTGLEYKLNPTQE